MNGKSSPSCHYRYQNQFDATPGTYKLAVVLSAAAMPSANSNRPLAIDPYDENTSVSAEWR